MEGLLLTDIGIEDAAALEIKERLGVKATISETAVKFPVKKYLDICKLAYMSQSARKVLLLLGDFTAKDLDSLVEKAQKILEKVDWKEWFKDSSFKVACSRLGDHSYVSRDVEEELGNTLGEILEKQLGKHPKVSLENPDIIIHCHINENSVFLGIDFSGRELSKRDYKAYLHTAAIRGNIAYGLIRMADFGKGKLLVDPFASEGTIPIEAAFHVSGKSVNFHEKELAFKKLIENDWDKWFAKLDKSSEAPGCQGISNSLRHVKHAKANAKVAGVNPEFYKCHLDALDVKLEAGAVDCIVTHPPQVSKHNKEPIKHYDELFYQATFILKKTGCIVALMINSKEFLAAAEKHGFTVVEKKNVMTGGLKYIALKLKPKT